jgi:hypothetical protein
LELSVCIRLNANVVMPLGPANLTILVLWYHHAGQPAADLSSRPGREAPPALHTSAPGTPSMIDI